MTRHSFLGVDPDWDDDLQNATVDLDEAVEIPTGSGRALKVFLNPDQAGRLREQIGLARSGYDQFFDAEANDQGYVAVHPSWRTLRGQQKLDGPAYRTLADEFDVAAVLAERGDLAQLNPDVQDLQGGPSDLIWNGLVTGVTTPGQAASILTGVTAKADAFDTIIANLKRRIDLGDLAAWARDNPGKTVWTLRRYQEDELEEVK